MAHFELVKGACQLSFGADGDVKPLSYLPAKLRGICAGILFDCGIFVFV
jgi:hypothetical protein